MKRQIINSLAALLLVAAATPSYSQEGGLLKGLKDKVTSGKSKEGPTKSEGDTPAEGGKTRMSSAEKEKAADLESKILDEKQFTKDKFDMSGIYYSTEQIKALNDLQSGAKYLSKFLVQYTYDEPAKRIELKITNRFSYETTNRANLVEPLYYSTSGAATYYNKAYEMTGLVVLDEKSYSHYSVKRPVYEYDLQRNRVHKGQYDFRGVPQNIYQAEPGILIFCADYIAWKKQFPSDEQIKLEPLLVFYKEGLEEKAQKYTGKDGYLKVQEIEEKFRPAFKQAVDGNATLPKATASFKDEPTNAALVEAVKKRMSEMPYYKNKTLVYVYNVDPWEQKFENIGLLGKTLTYRQMQVVAVFKDGNTCSYARMLIRQDNSYVGGTSQEKWTGNPVFCSGDQQLVDIACDKANTYKK